MNVKNNKYTLFDFSLIYLILYVFLGYIFTNTIFGNSIFVYASFMSLFGMFSLYFFCSLKGLRIHIYIALWIPYLLYTAIGYLSRGDIEHFAYWMICIYLICLANKYYIAERITYKMVFYLGVFFLIGITVQLLLPDFYYTHIAPVFKNYNQIAYWGRAYGFAGFSYQLDATAVPLAYAEGVFLFYLWEERPEINKWARCFVLGLFAIGILLTGKRMMLLIAVVVPIIVYLLSQKVLNKKILTVLFLVVALASSVLYIYANAELFIDNYLLRRIALTFINLKRGIDISTGRTELYRIAFEGFRNNPLFGIGIGNYSLMEGAYTATHNTYIQILCEQGLVGLLIFVLPLVYCYFHTVGKIRIACDNNYLRYYRLSLYIQTLYIFYSITANSNINLFGFVMYFLAISMLSMEKERH